MSDRFAAIDASRAADADNRPKRPVANQPKRTATRSEKARRWDVDIDMIEMALNRLDPSRHRSLVRRARLALDDARLAVASYRIDSMLPAAARKRRQVDREMAALRRRP